MILSTGREVVEYKEQNGSTFAEIAGGLQMSESEWEEYCSKIRALSLQQSRERLTNRKTK